MDRHVITISRQYGSGGRTIGMMLARRLGIDYYDKDIMRLASDESGIFQGLFGRVDEYSSSRPSLFSGSEIYTGELIGPDKKEFTSDQNLFNYQAKAIRQLAESENCVIVGRCSNYILRDLPYVLRVFVHADWDFRMAQTAEKQSMSPKEIEKYLKRDDRRKEEYVRRFTGKEWLDATQFDLCLDSGRLGFEACVNRILATLGS